MTLTRQMTFWVLTLVVGVLVLYVLREILLPFVAGMALAYLLDPLANRLERMGVNRLVATLVIIGAVVLIFVLLILMFVPILSAQLGAFVEKLPGYVSRIQAVAMDPNREWLRKIVGDGVADAQISDLVKQGAGWITTFLKSLWSGGQALISIFSLVVVTPVVAFYLLYDWNRMVATVDSWIPLHHRETVHALAREMNEAIAGFVRGQTAVCLILGSYYAVALTLTGLSFGLLIGLASGIITFIPYVGSMTGLVLAAGVAVAQFWPEYTPILTVLGIFFVGQFLEGYVLAPKLVGESVGLHPVWLMFALFAFGYLFGFVGLLIAVPLAAIIGVLARFALRRYLESPFYTGEPASGPVGFAPPSPQGARTGPMSVVSVPRQLALALPHAESFAREDFLTGSSNEAALGLIEALARLARPCAGAGRPGRRGQEPSGGDLGRDRGRAARLGARARRNRPAGRARDRRAGGRGCISADRRARAVPSAQPDAPARGLRAADGANSARNLGRRAARSRLAIARDSGGRTARAGRCAVARRAGQTVRRPPAWRGREP